MINAYLTTPVEVLAGALVPFASSRARSNGSCVCNGGWLNHSDGSGQFLVTRPGVYLATVGAQVTSDTAGDVATLSLTLNGEAIPGTAMAETITAAGDAAQLATSALIRVPCGASVTVGLANTGTADITVNAASLVLIRIS